MPYVSATLFVNIVSSTNRFKLHEKSSTPWHKHLGHISRYRMKRLIKDEILQYLDFSYFDTCVNCIKGKLIAKIRNVKADRCTKLLRVIHIDICGTFTPLAMGGHKYFVMFIDDYSQYGFIELIREKFESLEAFKAFKAKLNSNKGKISKWFILIEVVSIMIDMMRRDATMDHLQSTFRNVALMLSIRCMVPLNRIRLRRG